MAGNYRAICRSTESPASSKDGYTHLRLPGPACSGIGADVRASSQRLSIHRLFFCRRSRPARAAAMRHSSPLRVTSQTKQSRNLSRRSMIVETEPLSISARIRQIGGHSPAADFPEPSPLNDGPATAAWISAIVDSATQSSFSDGVAAVYSAGFHPVLSPTKCKNQMSVTLP